MPKPDRRSLTIRIQGLDRKHYHATDRYARQVKHLYNEAAKDYAELAAKGEAPDPGKAFSFADYPRARKEAARIAADLTKDVQTVIETGQRNEWMAATHRADEYLAGILDRSKLTPAELQQYEDRNIEGLAAFQKRKVQGLNLSDRVWKCTEQHKQQIELAIDVAIGEGKSAQQLARELQKYLQQPDKLFRRVRDKYGNLQLSKAAAAYHPGRGVYRSSYQNAMRLARSVINEAYRTAEWERWQRLDFVVGFRIGLSNNHTIINSKGEPEPLTDICDELAGDYPKTFKFVGWHPNCRCVVTPILQSPQEMHQARRERLRAIMNDEAYKAQPSANTVTDVPAGFKAHVKAIAERSKGWTSQPYWIRDNFKGGTIAGGLSPAIPHKAPIGGTTAKPNKPPQPCTEFDAQINEIKTWAYACGLDTSSLDPLRATGDRDGLKKAVEEAQKLMTRRKGLVEKWANVLRSLRAGEAAQYPDAIRIINEALTGYFDDQTYYEDAIDILQETEKEAKAIIAKARAEAKANADLPKEITDAKTVDDLAKAMADFDIVTGASVLEMSRGTLEQAKTICVVAYRMQQRYKLTPLSKLRIDKLRRGSGTVAEANGRGVTVNQAYMGTRNKMKLAEAYNDSCGEPYREKQRAKISNYIIQIRALEKRLQDPGLTPSDERLIRATIQSCKTFIKNTWDETRQYSCFTTGRSAETYLEDSVIHEYGHVIHDQLLGGINASLRNSGAFITAAEANSMNQDAQLLYGKYKLSKNPADRLWLSKYGFSDWQEFIAEAHVLYITGDPRLPADVKQWFIKLEKLAQKRP